MKYRLQNVAILLTGLDVAAARDNDEHKQWKLIHSDACGHYSHNILKLLWYPLW